MANFKISTGLRNTLADAITGLLDTGSTNPSARLLIYDGTQPTNPQTAVSTQVLLATVALHVPPSFGAAATGVITGDTIANVTVTNSGTAAWFRLINRAGTVIADGQITVTGGGGDMTFDNVTFVAGGTVSITSFTITVPQ